MEQFSEGLACQLPGPFTNIDVQWQKALLEAIQGPHSHDAHVLGTQRPGAKGGGHWGRPCEW